VASSVLVLDLGMIMAALAQTLGNDVLRRGFSTGIVETAVRPLIAPEQFEVGTDPPSLVRPTRSTRWNLEATGFSDPSGFDSLSRAAIVSTPTGRRRLPRNAE
jgi:hypothetical protein